MEIIYCKDCIFYRIYHYKYHNITDYICTYNKHNTFPDGYCVWGVSKQNLTSNNDNWIRNQAENLKTFIQKCYKKLCSNNHNKEVK